MKLRKNEEKTNEKNIKWIKFLLAQCSALHAQRSSFAYRLHFQFKFKRKHSFHIGLLYHSTTSVQFLVFSFLSYAFSWNEWFHRRDSYYIPGCDKLMDLRIVLIQFIQRILLNMNLYAEYWGLSGRHCCAYIYCQHHVSIKFKQCKSLQNSELRHFKRQNGFSYSRLSLINARTFISQCEFFFVRFTTATTVHSKKRKQTLAKRQLKHEKKKYVRCTMYTQNGDSQVGDS